MSLKQLHYIPLAPSQVIGGEVLGGGAAALPELAFMLAISIRKPIHRSNSWRVNSFFAFAANLSFVNSNMRSSCSSGITWTNAASGDMSAKSGFPGAILLPNGPFWYH